VHIGRAPHDLVWRKGRFALPLKEKEAIGLGDLEAIKDRLVESAPSRSDIVGHELFAIPSIASCAGRAHESRRSPGLEAVMPLNVPGFSAEYSPCPESWAR